MDRSSAKYASFENVYKIKITYYILSVKFKVEKHPAVEAEISGLEKPLQNFLKSEYKKIENEGIEFVKVRPLQDKIFEIKSNELRSLFRYKVRKNYCGWCCFCKENTEDTTGNNTIGKKRLKEV